jgi:hypothetical protein
MKQLYYPRRPLVMLGGEMHRFAIVKAAQNSETVCAMSREKSSRREITPPNWGD